VGGPLDSHQPTLLLTGGQSPVLQQEAGTRSEGGGEAECPRPTPPRGPAGEVPPNKRRQVEAD
jgi:hypothetical protein